ncbi:sigma factor [Streptomyces sp. NPDC006430]|uniref:sigma factor n=1 Tax=Streptomyces sp. NPDC006430 TaxID=3154299 RepID=UPI0033ABA2EE
MRKTGKGKAAMVMPEPCFENRTPSGPELGELMERVAQGDQGAFCAVYEAVASRVFGIVASVVRNRAQSEEAAQEVMIDLWRQAARYRSDRGSVMTWVATLAHRAAVPGAPHPMPGERCARRADGTGHADVLRVADDPGPGRRGPGRADRQGKKVAVTARTRDLMPLVARPTRDGT